MIEQLLAENEGKTIEFKETARWKVSSRTARSRLKQLQEQGVVVRIGTSESDPSASYIVAKRSS